MTAKQGKLRADELSHADTVAVQRGRSGKASVELRQTCPGLRAVGDRIRVQKWLHRGWSLQPRRSVWDHGLLCRGLAQPQPLGGEEEERLVLEDRPAEHTAKVILPLRGFRQIVEVHEPVPGVQHVIPEILEQRAMKSIGS